MADEKEPPPVRLPQRSDIVEGSERPAAKISEPAANIPEAAVKVPPPAANVSEPAKKPAAQISRPPEAKKLEDRLLDLIRDERMGEEEKAAVWTLVHFLTLKKGAVKAPHNE